MSWALDATPDVPSHTFPTAMPAVAVPCASVYVVGLVNSPGAYSTFTLSKVLSVPSEMGKDPFRKRVPLTISPGG